MISFEIDTSGLTAMEQSLARLQSKQFKYAVSQALNDCTRAASIGVNAAMPTIFDRPTAFTDRAAVAPRSLAATKDSLIATVTLRDQQAKYLQLEEEGGTRTAAANTRKTGAALILPGKMLQLDDFGNIPNGTLKAFRVESAQSQKARRRKLIKAAHRKQGKVQGPVQIQEMAKVIFLAANAPGNKAGIGGYFERLSRFRLGRLTAFEPETHYKARMGYHQRVTAIFQASYAPALARRFAEALSTSR